MAEQDNSISRLGFLPMVLGIVGPNSDQLSERLVLLNPFSQSMVILHGDAGILSAVLGGDAAGGAPASKESIEALKAVNAEEEDNSEEAECAVCLEKLFEKWGEEEEEEKEKEVVVVKEMPCGHRYHGECIEKWLKMHGSCPMCRYKMPAEEGEAKKGEEEGGGNGVWVRISFGRMDADAQPETTSLSD